MTGVQGFTELVLCHTVSHDRVQLNDTELLSAHVLIPVEESKLFLRAGANESVLAS